jgi:hypothetical protein
MAQPSLSTDVYDLARRNKYRVTVTREPDGTYSAAVDGTFDQKCDAVQYDRKGLERGNQGQLPIVETVAR